MDRDIRELQEKAKELRVASEQLTEKTELLQAQTARLIDKEKYGGTKQAPTVVFRQIES